MHPVWEAPTQSNPPVTKYELRICQHTQCDSTGPEETITLETADPDWAGPEAGHYVAQFDGKALVPGQQLTFKVRACNEYEVPCGQWSELLNLTTAQAVPGETPTPELRDLNATAITVEVHPAAFTGGPDILSYELRVSTLEGDHDHSFPGATPPFTWVMTGRRTDLQYWMRSRAVNGLGEGPWSGTLEVASGADELPFTPTGLAVLTDPAVAARSFSISWSMPPGNRSENILYYRIEMTDDGTGMKTERKLSGSDISGVCTSGDGCSAAVNGVVPDTDYNLTIAAYNSRGAGQISDSASVSTLADVPDAVTGLQLVNVSQTDAEVSWVEPASNGQTISMYRIHTCEQLWPDNRLGGCIFDDVIGNPPATRGLADDLTPGRNFTLEVEVFNSEGSGGNTTADVTFTTRSVPAKGHPCVKRAALPGLSQTTTIRVAWPAPYDNGLPILLFNLSIDGMNFPVRAKGQGSRRDPGRWYEYTAGLEQSDFYPGTEHAFRVLAINELGAGPWSDVNMFTTDKDVPGTPPAPVTTSVTDTEIRVRVQPSLYSGGEEIQYYELRLDHQNNTIERVLPSDMTYNVTNRDGGLEYVFRSRAYSGYTGSGMGGYSAWSDELRVASLDAQRPAQPISLAVVPGSVASRSFNISWSMPAGERSANVRLYYLKIISPSGEHSRTVQRTDCVAGCTRKVDAELFEGIAPATAYTLTIAAENDRGTSIDSAATAVTTRADAPDPVAHVNVSGVTPIGLTVGWSTPASNGAALEEYQIYVCEEVWTAARVARGGCYVARAGPADITSVITGLETGRNFSVHVDAFNSVGSSGNTSAPETVTTLAAPMQGHPPRLPSRLPGLDFTTTIHVVWDPPYANGVPISNYTIQVDGEAPVTVLDSQFSRGGFFPGTDHSFRVRAVNGLGAGEFSEAVTFTTDKDVPGTPPSPLTISVSSSEIRLRVVPAPYSGGELVQFYELEFGHENGRIVPVAVSGDMTYTVPDRDVGLEYVFRSRAYSGYTGSGKGGYSAWSDELVVESVDSQRPSTPISLAVVPGSVASRSFNISWSMPEGERSDNVLRYKLELVSSRGCPSGCVLTIALGDCTAGCTYAVDAALFEAIAPMTAYNLTIQSENLYGTSVKGAQASTVTLADAPDPVGSVNITRVEAAELAVAWPTPANNGASIDRFVVYACEEVWSSAGFTRGGCYAKAVNGAATATTVPSLPAGRNFTVLVDAVNAVGSSGNTSSSARVTTKAVPMQGHAVSRQEMPGALKTSAIHVVWASPYGNGLPVLNFTLESEPVEPALNPETNYGAHRIVTVPATDKAQGGFVQGGFLPGTSHRFRVRASNALGAGEYSNWTTLKTEEGDPGQCPPPTPLAATGTQI